MLHKIQNLVIFRNEKKLHNTTHVHIRIITNFMSPNRLNIDREPTIKSHIMAYCIQCILYYIGL